MDPIKVILLRRRGYISNATAATLMKAAKKKMTPKLKDGGKGLDQGQSVASVTGVPFMPQTPQDKTRCTPLPT